MVDFFFGNKVQTFYKILTTKYVRYLDVSLFTVHHCDVAAIIDRQAIVIKCIRIIILLWKYDVTICCTSIHTEFHQEPSMMSSSIRSVDYNRSDVPFSQSDDGLKTATILSSLGRRLDDVRRADSWDRLAPVL